MHLKSTRAADCHPDRPYLARGKCAPCYQREFRAGLIPTGTVAICHLDRTVYGNGLCLSCYRLGYESNRSNEISAIKRKWHQRTKAERREKMQAKDRERYVRNAALIRDENRVKKGWTTERFDEMWDAQEGCCAICGKEMVKVAKETHADHDHVSGEPRGILCSNCNVGIGNLGDDPERLRLAIEYLESHR